MTAGAQYLETGTAPATLASNTGIYPDSSGNLHQLKAAGTDVQIVGGGVGTSSTPADPTGNATGTATMMGLAGSFTPVRSGNVFMVISGTVQNNTNADGANVQLSYGTGSAPANAATLTGTQVGTAFQCSQATATTEVAFIVHFVVTGLTLNTAYWYDLALKDVTGGTAAAKRITMSVFELP